MKKFKIKKRYIATILILLIIITSIVITISMKNKKAPDYSIVEAKRGNIIQTVEASGTINPVQSVNIGSQVSGKIDAIYVDYNSEVKKGQLLAEIDPSLFQSNVDKAESDLRNAMANYEATRADYIFQKANYKRYEQLYSKHYVSKSETELAYANYKAAEATLASRQALIDQARANLENSQTNLGYTKIISPVDGIVTAKKVEVGQTVAASYQTPELFVVAEDLTNMQIEVNVSEADIGRIKEGQEVEYTLDGYPDEKFEGVVTQIRLDATTVSNVTTYTVVVGVSNDQDILKPGMTANVIFITQNKKNVLLVSNNAFKYFPADNPQKYEHTGVWILKNKKDKERVEVETGIKDSNFTEIVSGDIQEGTKVLVPYQKKPNKNNMRPPMRMF